MCEEPDRDFSPAIVAMPGGLHEVRAGTRSGMSGVSPSHGFSTTRDDVLLSEPGVREKRQPVIIAPPVKRAPDIQGRLGSEHL